MSLIKTSDNKTIWQSSGRLPSTYQEVEWIQSDATQYIDMGFKHNQTTQYFAHFKWLSGNNGSNTWGSIFGFRTTYNQNSFSCNFQKKGTNRTLIAGGIYSPSAYFEVDYIENNTDIELEFDINHFKVNDTNITITNPIYFGDAPANAWLFASHNGSNDSYVDYPSKIRLYSFTVYHNNSKIREFVPCYRKSDNEIGLYDLVNDSFYTKVTGNNFTKGDDV